MLDFHYVWDADESDSAYATYQLVTLMQKLNVGYEYVSMKSHWDEDDRTLTIRYKYPGQKLS